MFRAVHGLSFLEYRERLAQELGRRTPPPRKPRRVTGQRNRTSSSKALKFMVDNSLGDNAEVSIGGLKGKRKINSKWNSNKDRKRGEGKEGKGK